MSKSKSKAHQRILDIYGSTVKSLDRDFYKATECGGYVELRPDGSIAISTIVEVSDAEFSDIIHADATKKEIRAAVQNMEEWAARAWEEVNEAEERREAEAIIRDENGEGNGDDAETLP